MLILFSIFCLVGAQKMKPACKNTTTVLEKSWTSKNLPFENCTLGEDRVYYTYVFPSDTILCGPFRIWLDVFNGATGYSAIDPLSIVDAFGMEHLDQFSTEIGYCFSPPQMSFSISKEPDYSWIANPIISLRPSMGFSSEGYRLVPLNYKKVERYSVHPGMEPLILAMNSSMKNEVLYKIRGHPKLTAFYVRQTDFWPRSEPTVSASSVFVLNGSDPDSGVIDSVANWNGAREFSELNFVKMGPANHNEMNAPALMLLMASSDFEDLHEPQFVWPQGIYDVSSGSSITLVDLDTYSKKCRYYTVNLENLSSDLEIIIYSGFPKKNIKETTVIGRYSRSQLDYFTLVLGCTNTIQIQQGSVQLAMEYLTVWSPGQHMLFLSEYNPTLVVKTEAKVSGYNTKIELSIFQNHDEIPAGCRVDWRVMKSDPGSTIKMHKWLENGDGGRDQFNLDFTRNGNFSLGKAAGVQWTNVNFCGPMTVEFVLMCHE